MKTWQFAALINFSLETLLANFVSLTHPSLHILDKTQTVLFPTFGFLVNPLQKSCHNSRTSTDIDMKVGPVTKLDKSNTATSEKLEDDVLLANDNVIVTF